MRMSALIDMGYYPAFPPAVPRKGVGCIRVTHPCATLASPKGRLPFDLHVLGLPLAFILSQDQTLHCIIVVLNFNLCLGLRYDSKSLILLLSLFIVLASSFQRTFVRGPLFLRGENGCKGTTFFLSRKLFFTFFEKKSSSKVNYLRINGILLNRS